MSQFQFFWTSNDDTHLTHDLDLLFVRTNLCLPDTTWELIVVMATLPCCRPPAGTTIPEGLTELETEVMDGEEVWISSWGITERH